MALPNRFPLDEPGAGPGCWLTGAYRAGGRGDSQAQSPFGTSVFHARRRRSPHQGISRLDFSPTRAMSLAQAFARGVVRGRGLLWEGSYKPLIQDLSVSDGILYCRSPGSRRAAGRDGSRF